MNKEKKALLEEIMSELGRKGGKIGGKRSLETMTPEERRERAIKAVQAREAKRNERKRRRAANR